MLRSMYSGISGLQNHQTKLDVIGNNIANVNTHAFKKGRFAFKDMMSQQVQGATAGTDEQGGRNSMQIGLGTQAGAIDTLHTQGALQPTNRELDMAITGDGYFRVNESPEGTGEMLYTRAGNFHLDSLGRIVNPDGLFLQNNTEDGGAITIPTNADSYSIAPDGTVSYNLNGTIIDGQNIGLANFANPEGLETTGGNLYRSSENSGEVLIGSADENGRGEIVSGALEMSNVDLSEEFVEMITAQRGLQANTRIITTSDEVLQELLNLK